MSKLLKTTFFLTTFFLATATAQPPGGPPGGGGGASGDGIWTRNAAFGELETFDLCNGHQPGTGMYHHHIDPICLRAQLNDNVILQSSGRLGNSYVEKSSGFTHSPILGWASDGYPVYGPYGYTNSTDAKSAVKRMQTGFRLRDIAQRHTLPDWVLPFEPSAAQNLTAAQYGPDVNATFPLGRYVQDYEYVAGLGDLDRYNGRFTVTPEYPNGTYAYFVTIASDGTPAFPYIFNVQFYGTNNGGNAQTVAADAVDYFTSGALTQAASPDPQLATWYTRGSLQNAVAISGFDPAAGASTTWPLNVPTGVTVMGGNKNAALADIQRVRYNASSIFINSNNLPSYTLGPWFEGSMTGGVFMNWPSASNQQVKVPRTPAVAATKTSTGMGIVGIWVNGVAIFNVLDGATYSNAAGLDQGGGGVSARTVHFSAASAERGPLAAGSLATAYPEFGAVLATSTATASTAAWPFTLGGATVTLTDSSGAQLPAAISYASPGQVNYQIPVAAAAGVGKVIISAGGVSVMGTVNIVATYPGIFQQTPGWLAAAQILRVRNGVQTVETVTDAPVAMGTDALYLILYGTGIGKAVVSVTLGGVPVTVAYSGAQGTYPGLDQLNIPIPAVLSGKGKVSAVVTASGKVSNSVYFNLQ